MERADPLRIGDELLTRLRSFIRKRVSSSADADDVLQTVLVRFLERRGDLTPESLPAWTFRVARIVIADLHRGRMRETRSDDSVPEVAGAEPLGVPGIAECVQPLLATLPRSARELLQRVDVEGVSQVALARELGVSVTGMKSRIQRARARLRGALLARCTTEWDARGRPSGDASCKGSEASDCGCAGARPAPDEEPRCSGV